MHLIETINEKIGKASSWFSLALVFVIVLDVILRYLFSITSAASFELEWHLFASLFLLSAGYTFQMDKHVRVDVFYNRFSIRQKALVNLIGGLVLLIPFCLVAIWESLPFVWSSYSSNETSPQPGGLPARWIIKAVIPLAFLLLLLQGSTAVIKSFKTVLHGEVER